MSGALIRDLRTIPNMISISRVILLAVAIGIFYLTDHKAIAIFIGTIAGITDYLDGILARRLGQETQLGAILDQYADMLFESFGLLLACTYSDDLSPLVLAIYLPREFWVTTIRRAAEAKQIIIPSNFYGKLKTNFMGWGFMCYFIAITDVAPWSEPWSLYLGYIGIYGGIGFSYLSGVMYTREFVKAYDQIAD